MGTTTNCGTFVTSNMAVRPPKCKKTPDGFGARIPTEHNNIRFFLIQKSNFEKCCVLLLRYQIRTISTLKLLYLASRQTFKSDIPIQV